MTLVVGIWLSDIDIREHRLPNRIVLWFTLALWAALIVASALSGEWDRLGSALLGGLAMSLVYLTLALIGANSMGMGDVKLAFPLGSLLAWVSWYSWVLGLIGAFVLGGAVALIFMLARRTHLKAQVAFGPAMVASALAAATLTALAP